MKHDWFSKKISQSKKSEKKMNWGDRFSSNVDANEAYFRRSQQMPPPFGQPFSRPRTRTQRVKSWLLRNWFWVSVGVLMLIGLYKNGLRVTLQPLKPSVTTPALPPQNVQGSYTAADEMREQNGQQPLNIGSIFETVKEEPPKSESKPSPKSATKKVTVKKAAPLADMPQTNVNEVVIYCKKYANVAIAERKKFGIPSSIILANAVRQSFSGKRDCAKRANNHFALPASADWAGNSAACANGKMRQYESVWLSFRDHSLFLTSGRFVGIKQKYQPTEYKSWAKAIQDASYPNATNRLAEELILIVEKYQLYRLDKL